MRTRGKKLDVVHHDREWVITGLKSGPLHLYLHIPYPETEWPEVTSRIENAEKMHRALYDLWQTSDKRNGELLFHTPFGDFATAGVHIVPAEDAAAARAGVKAQRKRSARWAQIERSVMAREGFGPKRMEDIYAQYGHRFADWPRDLVKAWNNAYTIATETARAQVHGGG